MNGLHVCKAGNAPQVGQVKTFVVNGDRIKSKPADQGGQSYRIVSVEQSETYKDSYQNLGFNLVIEPAANGGTHVPAQQSGKPKWAGADDPRHHTMRAANLLLLCKNAAKAVLGQACDPEDARSLFIYLSRAGYVAEMPDKPMGKEQSNEPEPSMEEPPHTIGDGPDEESF